MTSTLALAIALAIASAIEPATQTPASPEVPTDPLTLASAMAWAREHAPAAASAQAQTIIARARVDVARALLWPTVSGSLASGVGAARNHGLFNDEVCADPSLAVACSQSRAFGDVDGSASVDVRYTVFDFGRRALLIQAASRSAQAATLDAKAVGEEIAAAAAVAFLTARATEELRAGRADIVERRAKSLVFAEERVRIGVAPPIEATRARVSKKTAELDLATADAAVDDAHASLARALGLDVSPAHGAQRRRLALTPPGELNVNDDPGHADDLAEQTRHELRAQRQRIAAADADSENARAQLWPSLDATAAANARATGYTSQSSSAAESASAGLVLRVPLLDVVASARTRLAEGAATAQRAVERERVFAVRADAAQAAVAVRSHKQATFSAAVLVDEAEANLAQAEGRYQAGAGSLLELVDAQTQQSSAQLALVQTRFQLAIARARLLAAMGTLGAD